MPQWRLKIPRATTKTWSNQIHTYIHSHIFFFFKSMLWGSHRNKYSNGLDLRSPGRQSIQDPHPPITTPSTHCSPLPLSTKVGTKAARHSLISTAGEKQICLLSSKIQKIPVVRYPPLDLWAAWPLDSELITSTIWSQCKGKDGVLSERRGRKSGTSRGKKMYSLHAGRTSTSSYSDHLSIIHPQVEWKSHNRDDLNHGIRQLASLCQALATWTSGKERQNMAADHVLEFFWVEKNIPTKHC